MPGIVEGERPEITVPWPMGGRLTGVRPHQSTCLPEGHCTRVGGVPVTTPARTLVDLASVLSGGLLERVVDDSLRRRLASLAELRAVHDRLSESGRRGMARMALVLAARPDSYQPGDSDAELRLVRALVAGGHPRPIQQHQVHAGGTVYLLDLAYPQERIGIEFDGFGSHGATRSSLDRDRVRANALTLAGWTVLHFTSASTPSQVVADVRTALEGRASADSLRSRPRYDRDNCG
jgi:hypothetical protein